MLKRGVLQNVQCNSLTTDCIIIFDTAKINVPEQETIALSIFVLAALYQFKKLPFKIIFLLSNASVSVTKLK